MRTAVFTIISPNYRHHVRALMDSARRHQPEWDRFVLLAGGTAFDEQQREDAFETLALSDLDLPHEAQFRFRYTLLELDTAVKPWVFAQLFARGYDSVVYLDPDTLLYSALEEIENTRDTLLVLTPHLTHAPSPEERFVEQLVLRAGTYNLGFLAVFRHPDLDRFLAWWRARLERLCIVDVENGIFVDQKWMEFTPGMFRDVRVLRHDGYNVAYWNLRQRTIAHEAGGFTVNGQPLRFVHFSGFDPAAPQKISRHDASLKMADAGDAQQLFGHYASALRVAGSETFRSAPYAFATFHDGTPIADFHRAAYRNSETLQAGAGEDPFAHPELFRRLRDTSRGAFVKRVGLASYRILSSARPLVRLLPEPVRIRMREVLLGRREQHATDRDAMLPPGINVIGYHHETGVGESARLFLQACAAAEIATQFIDAESEDGRAARYRTSVLHVNADMMPETQRALASVLDASAYKIGVWHWELPELPDSLSASAAALDEIWAPSALIQSAVSRKTTIPVVHMPHGVAMTHIEPCSPEELGVPRGRFTFLCMFDLASVVERKNPFGAIEAFRRAFGATDAVALLVKTSGPDAELAERVKNMPNVFLIDRRLPRARVNGLLAASDAIVSLHRSEGFGLVLAEAMSLGKPVIATGWSGNMDFMTAANSLPVGFDLITLERTYGPYNAGEQWAEPDVDDAARSMRRVFEDADLRARLGANAQETIRSRFSPAAAGHRYRRRLQFLGLA